ncbi:DUF2510 domain-containing protein [Microbacterium sp. No. 7]|uniref:DUF2510 domain-containing protein n=1 Tax=Microbacterium sp. No. 7 TaxID=1714373 RepID=UPI0009E9B06C
MTSLPPGWYPDQVEPGMFRYWSGTAWVEGPQQHPGEKRSEPSAQSRRELRRQPARASRPPTSGRSRTSTDWAMSPRLYRSRALRGRNPCHQ